MFVLCMSVMVLVIVFGVVIGWVMFERCFLKGCFYFS